MGDFGGGYTGSMDATDYGFSEEGGRHTFSQGNEGRGERGPRGRQRDDSLFVNQPYSQERGGGQRLRGNDADYNDVSFQGASTGPYYGSSPRGGLGYDTLHGAQLGGGGSGYERDDYGASGMDQDYGGGGLDSPFSDSRAAELGQGGFGRAGSGFNQGYGDDQTRDEYGNPIGHFRSPQDPRFNNRERPGGPGPQGGQQGKQKKGGFMEKAMHVVDDLI